MRFSILVFALLVSIFSCTPNAPKSDLPGIWGKEFSISLYTGGGMQNQSTYIDYTYDSCIYVERVENDKKVISFPLTEGQRAEILANMQALQLDKIREVKTEITYDKESDRICFQNQKEFCVSDGAVSEIHQDDRARFFEVYKFLMDFAKQKGELVK